jgi:predicted secreted Zn-dependent protease
MRPGIVRRQGELRGVGLNKSLCLGVVALCLASGPRFASAEWQPVEKEALYTITGQTGAELYASIGERGPKAGISRAIAHTNFKLTWTRKYEEQGGACVLAVAKPKLIITYTLPKPARPLPSGTRENWDIFIDGVRKHELVHGDFIKEMVRAIEQATLGLTVPDDPKCRKIRTVMTERLGALSQTQRQRSRDFDQVELTDGGNIHQLILKLVNGP